MRTAPPSSAAAADNNATVLTIDGKLKKPPSDVLCLIISDNACILCLTVVTGTKLVDAYSPDIIIASSQGKEVHDP
ncbi:hypothetical protein Lal_00012031 [Lupinus albus]|nr:hypothetical protein Lal_00012031 [Lupinus albus]